MLWLLGSESIDDRQDRAVLDTNLSSLYDSRSRIVHQGDTVVDRADLSEMRTRAAHAIFAFVEMWALGKTQEEIIKSLDNKMKGI